MTTWTAAPILDKPGLRLTAAEIAAIGQRMPPVADDGYIYVDGVFEGGGVRGFAFLGALRCIADLGFRWRKVAGTSAGAITAAMVAADFSIEELEDILGRLDYRQFLSQRSSGFIWDRDPSDDLQDPFKMMLQLTLAHVFRQSRCLGQYSSEPFRAWLAATLAQKGMTTFAHINPDPVLKRDLKVVASDISRGEMLVLPDDLARPDPLDPMGRSPHDVMQLAQCQDFEIAEAVRLSMSIPLFFEPGYLTGGNPTGNSEAKPDHAPTTQRLIVDGGILSNFPLWIYDFKPNPQNPGQTRPRWPTFGFRLVSQTNQTSAIDGPFELLGAMFKTMMVARDQYHLNELKQDRVVDIDISSAQVTATDFNLSDDKKNLLYELGYATTKTFFQTWDWAEHLRRRGYGPESEK